ncbi:DUF4007 family protein [Anabaenopsis tanganyikae]|uniref:DUF4007 family protein n=1 Tax=Anabaenopsis tanganyikae TaxID=2785302 RepID=UPI00314506F0
MNFLLNKLNELGLIRTFGKNYQFKIGNKTNLPAEIIVAACLEYASRVNYGGNTINISSLLYNEGTPGMAFKLTKNVRIKRL